MPRSRQRGAAAGRTRQRGAAAVFAAITILLGLVCVGLAVDLGTFYYQKRSLQRIANMAALDAARAAGGCIGNVSNPAGIAAAEAANSVVRNGGTASWASGGVLVGSLTGFKAVRSFSPVFDPKNRAVQVKLTRSMPSRLVPLLSSTAGDPTKMTATASAYSSPSATVIMGTQVLNVDTSGASNLNKLLTGLLGGPVSLSALTYNSLLSANVQVGDILAQLNIGTPDQLSVASVSQRTLLGALVAALNAQGSTAAAQAAQSLYNVASSSNQVLPAQVLGVSNPATSAALGAGDIAMAIAELAASGTLINIPVGLPAPLNGLLSLSLINPGSPTLLVPGGIDLFPSNFANNTQALVRSNASVSIPLNIPLVLSANVSASLPLFVQAGKGTAEIDHLDCARRGQNQNLAYVRAQTGILTVGLGNFSNINSPNPVATRATILDVTVNILSIVPVHIAASALVSIPLASSNSILATPFTEGQTQHLGTPRVSGITSGLAGADIDVTVDTLQIIGNFPLLTGAINSALGLLKPLVQSLLQAAIVTQLSALVDQAVLPLLDQAGITVGGADVTVTSIEADNPYIFAH